MFSNVRIEKLILSNYRNHKFLELKLKKNIILICGKNGSGKTNILESISLLTSSSGLKKTNFRRCVVRKVDLFKRDLSIIFGQNKLTNLRAFRESGGIRGEMLWGNLRIKSPIQKY